MRVRPTLNNPWWVALLFTTVAIAFTWPLAANFTTKTPADLGDPLFICWVLMWTGGQTLRFLSGDWHALADYWNANIFYPETLTLAYSEHFTGQMLQILPVFAATGNIVLCYNLLFLSTYVLSGLGMYLLVRELTGNPLAGVLAGVAFAFAPYRADQIPHLQVLSSQWMPLALYGFRRYFTTLRTRPLIGASAALVMQVLSCGYYFFFFVPVAAAYCLYELVARRLLTTRRVLISVVLAGTVTLTCVLPFLLPYSRLRAQQHIGQREMAELVEFSADTYAFATASEHLAFQTVKALPKAEGQAFVGFAVLLFALIGVATGVRTARRDAIAQGVPAEALWRRIGGGIALAASGVFAVAFLSMAVRGKFQIHALGDTIRLRDATAILIKLAACLGVAMLLLRRLRISLTSPRGSFLMFCLLALISTAFFTLGPSMMVKRAVIGAGPYLLLYLYVPGFDGLRVPARFLMVTLVFLSVLAGLGAASLLNRWRRAGSVLVAAGIVAICLEGWMAPVELSRRIWPGIHYVFADFEAPSASTLGAVYSRLRDEPNSAAVVEFPFGEPSFDVRSVYMAGFHRKRLVNGYSGFFPQSFRDNFDALAWDPADRARAWATLNRLGVTHVVVHEGLYFDEHGPGISAWLRTMGARELAAQGTDRLFVMR